MNKKQLAGRVADKTELTKADAERLIDLILGQITDALLKGEKVRLVGFGNFVIRKRKGRIGRNPQTGDKITIDAETHALTLHVDANVVKQRLAMWQQPKRRYERGVLAKYAKLVSSASEGAVTDKYLD